MPCLSAIQEPFSIQYIVTCRKKTLSFLTLSCRLYLGISSHIQGSIIYCDLDRHVLKMVELLPMRIKTSKRKGNFFWHSLVRHGGPLEFHFDKGAEFLGK